MTIQKYLAGQELTAERLNRLVAAALQNIVGGDGIQITRSGNSVHIGLARAHRGIPPNAVADGVAVANVTGIVSAETASGGSAATAGKSDGAPGLKIAHRSGKRICGIKFIVDEGLLGLGLEISGAANDGEERAAVHNHDTDGTTARSTLEVVPDEGGQVKLHKSWSAGDEQKARIVAGESGLYGRVADNGLIGGDAGVDLPAGAGGKLLFHNGTKWVVLSADAGKYLKSGASAVSWDTPATTIPSVVRGSTGGGGAETHDYATFWNAMAHLDGVTISTAGVYLFELDISVESLDDVLQVGIVTGTDEGSLVSNRAYSSIITGYDNLHCSAIVSCAASDHVFPGFNITHLGGSGHFTSRTNNQSAFSWARLGPA